MTSLAFAVPVLVLVLLHVLQKLESWTVDDEPLGRPRSPRPGHSEQGHGRVGPRHRSRGTARHG